MCALTFLSISKTFFPSILRIDIASVSGRSDDRSLFAGAGVNFNVTENLLLNAQYTWYDVDLNADNVSSDSKFKTDFNQASVGAEYRF